MDHLSSCYFCGTAVDERLRQYRVVPVELRDSDDGPTATLCSSCHGKLERLLGPVAEAAGADGATLDARDADRQSTDAGDDDADRQSTDAGDDDADRQSTDAGDDDADRQPTDAGHGDATGADGPPETTGVGGADADDDGLVDVEPNLVDVDDPLGRSDASAGEEGTVRVTHTETAEGGADEPGPDSGADDSEGSDPEGAAEDHRSETESGEGEGEESAETEGGASTETEDAESGEGEGEESSRSDGEESGEGDGGDTAQTTVSALEYNKVMRLLQNRDFPVDRAEIQTVAANAYGLAEHECASVIDLAIDRGLIGEQDGKLVRPE